MTEVTPQRGLFVRVVGSIGLAATSLATLGLLGFAAFIALQGAMADPPAPDDDQSLAGVGLIFIGGALVVAWFFAMLTAALGAALGFWRSRIGELLLLVPVGAALVALPIVIFLQEVVF